MAAVCADRAAVVAEAGAFAKYDKMGEDSGSVGAAALSAVTNSYVVTEKVHGANFCLIAKFCRGAASAVEVFFAKRTAIIGRAQDAEDFYSCRSAGLLRALVPCVEMVLRRIAGEAEVEASCAADAVHIYGELFGGSYPHPDVPAVLGLQPVQVGVWYSPTLQFMAFDVAVESAGRRGFLDFEAARTLCEECGLMFARPLCEGALSECLDFPIEFETTLPARLGLPPLPPGAGGGERNVAEGVVVRPAREPLVQRACSGKTAKESARGLFKRKIEAFSEKRYQNDDWKKGKSGGAGAGAGMDEELVRLEIAALVTEQRLANVQSKTGRVDPSDRPACRQLLQDLKDDVTEALEPDDAAALRRSPALGEELDQLSRRLINTHFRAAAQAAAARPAAAPSQAA